jgi:hypothetical protein
MKKVILLSIVSISIGAFFAFTYSENNKSKEERFCVDVNCDGKRHYELSPPAFSMSDAIQKMKKRYPDCKITGASKGSCK